MVLLPCLCFLFVKLDGWMERQRREGATWLLGAVFVWPYFLPLLSPSIVAFFVCYNQFILFIIFIIYLYYCYVMLCSIIFVAVVVVSCLFGRMYGQRIDRWMVALQCGGGSSIVPCFCFCLYKCLFKCLLMAGFLRKTKQQKVFQWLSLSALPTTMRLCFLMATSLFPIWSESQPI